MIFTSIPKDCKWGLAYFHDREIVYEMCCRKCGWKPPVDESALFIRLLDELFYDDDSRQMYCKDCYHGDAFDFSRHVFDRSK